MKPCRNEPTLREALSDPLIRAIMKADGVDPHELAVSLAETASALRRRGPSVRPARSADTARTGMSPCLW